MMFQVNDKPIGIFDSGIGGLTVAGAIHRLLPSEDIIYLGDTARVPYGTKSAETISRYALECALYLLNRDVKMIVAACNTVSSVALPKLKEILRVPIIGVVDPGAKNAVQKSKNRRIGVIGTTQTIKSNAYFSRISALDDAIKVWSQATPLLAPMVEEGRVDGPIVEQILEEYLDYLLEQKIDTLVLGCTHYPLLKDSIENICGKSIALVDSADTTAREVEEILLRESLMRTYGTGEVKCFFTDLPRSIDPIAERFFGQSIEIKPTHLSF